MASSQQQASNPNPFPSPLLPVERSVYSAGEKMLRDPVSVVDQEIYGLMQQEKLRQRRGFAILKLIDFLSQFSDFPPIF